ncbi:macrolide family glycosyltransferase [Actinokineospora sp.]|uniref:macrolide family glycosyltransferase n=1 Tax=Actinokineospora sp. TaxID=1872133 RepID=UPI003D6A0A08
MPHVAFMAVPAHGHVNPNLALVAELVGRGHRVTFAINDEFAAQVRAAGAEVVPYESTFSTAVEKLANEPDDLASAQRMFHDEMVAVTPQVEAAYTGDRPDVIVYDIGAWHAPILAAKWNVPAIQLSPTFVAYDGMAEDFGIDLDAEPTPAMAALIAEFDEFAAAQGVDLTRDEVIYLPKRCVVTIPRTWLLKGEMVADHYTFVGPSVDTRVGEWTAPDDRPVLLVSLGSAYNDRLDFYRECVRAFTGLDWHVLLSVGKSIDPAELGEVPANFEVVQWVPQVSVLAKASAFVTHAGMGSTMEGLYFGVPMVAVPQAVDQFMNGARLAELGLGAHVPMEEATADTLRAAVLRVTSDPDITARVKSVRDEVRAAGGAAKAADVVESVV